MGLSNLPLKLAIFIKGLIIPAMLAAAGFVAQMDPATATPELKAGITTLFCTIPGCTVLAGAVLLTFGYRLTTEKVLQYQNEIDARKRITE
jgi:GPH family glycoside/pentoside/hexuronide:cation symporter